MSLKSEILEELRRRGGYVSGEELAHSLKKSRTAVWKAVNARTFMFCLFDLGLRTPSIGFFTIISLRIASLKQRLRRAKTLLMTESEYPVIVFKNDNTSDSVTFCIGIAPICSRSMRLIVFFS